MMVSWDGLPITNTLPVLGFQLLVDDGLGNDGSFEVVHDSGNNPQTQQFLVTGLSQGLTYRFQVKARDINGLGPGSPLASFLACLGPAGLKQPVLQEVSKTEARISWRAPEISGGCPVSSYSLELNDLTGPAYSSLETGISALTFERAVSLSDKTGQSLRIRVIATNQAGSTTSPALQFVLASVPGKPSPAPVSDPAGTSVSAIKVKFINTNADTGGTEILLYELQMDDGASGEFSTIFSSSQLTEFTVTVGISRGKYYRFRYRARNIIGYSPYSDVSYLEAVDQPARPSPPTFVSATDDQIVIKIFESTDSQGRDVTAHEVWIDSGGDLTSSFRKVTTYDGSAQTCTVTRAADSLGLAGTLYRFKVRAKNADGVYSELSDALVVALGSVPAAPAAPTKDDDASGDG